MAQACGAGLVVIRRTADQLAFMAPPTLRSGPLGDELTEEIARQLGIGPHEIVSGQWVDGGPGWLAVGNRTVQPAYVP